MSIVITLLSFYCYNIKIFFAGACNDGLAVLTGPRGVFSTKGAYYENNERCSWRIEVDKGMVRTVICLEENAPKD